MTIADKFLTMDEVLENIQDNYERDIKMSEQIIQGAQGRFMTNDEDADQSYLEGKIGAYEHTLMMLRRVM
jgi:phage gp36-like protein